MLVQPVAVPTWWGVSIFGGCRKLQCLFPIFGLLFVRVQGCSYLWHTPCKTSGGSYFGAVLSLGTFLFVFWSSLILECSRRYEPLRQENGLLPTHARAVHARSGQGAYCVSFADEDQTTDVKEELRLSFERWQKACHYCVPRARAWAQSRALQADKGPHVHQSPRALGR